jgi:hypothetical protein
MEVFRLKRKSLKLWWEPEAEIPAENFLKFVGILPLTAQYTYSITMFIVRNSEYFMENSESSEDM